MARQADKIAAQLAAQLTHSNSDQDETETEKTARVRGQRIRTTRVRRTVDLSPWQHDELSDWQRETARQLGLARVTAQQVLGALVHRLLTDETLARKIRADLNPANQ